MGWSLYASASGDLELGNGKDRPSYYGVYVERRWSHEPYAQAYLRWSDSRYSYSIETDYIQLPKGTRCRIKLYRNSNVVIDEKFILKGSDEVSFSEVEDRGYLKNDYIKIELYEYISEPPLRPSSITVPSEVKGEEAISISWGSGSGATLYDLERSINGGSWTLIHTGSSRNYTDTALSTWETVTYRVRSYNSDGYSSYRTSDSVKVINFPQLKLKIDGTLKVAEKGYVKVNNQLMEIDKMWVKINGKLKEVE